MTVHPVNKSTLLTSGHSGAKKDSVKEFGHVQM